MKLNCCIKELDLFGVPFMFTTNKKNYFKSMFGGIMSIISILAVGAFSIYLSRDFFLRLNPKINQEKYPAKEIPFYNITNDLFFFGFFFQTSKGERIIDYNNYFTVNPTVYTYEDATTTNFTTYNLKADYCEKIISNKTFLDSDANDNAKIFKTVKNIICVDFGKDSLLSTLGGDWTNKNRYISIHFYPCNKEENSSCKTFEESFKWLKEKDIYISILVPTYSYESADDTYRYSNPLKRQYDIINIPMSNYNWIFIDTFYNLLNSFDDQDYVFKNPTKKSLLYFDKMNYYSSYQGDIDGTVKNDGNIYGASVSIYFTREIYSIKRFFMKIQELLSLIGGFVSIIFSSIGQMCQYYNLFLRNISLLSDSFTFIEDEKNEDFAFENVNSENFEKSDNKITNESILSNENNMNHELSERFKLKNINSSQKQNDKFKMGTQENSKKNLENFNCNKEKSFNESISFNDSSFSMPQDEFPNNFYIMKENSGKENKSIKENILYENDIDKKNSVVEKGSNLLQNNFDENIKENIIEGEKNKSLKPVLVHQHNPFKTKKTTDAAHIKQIQIIHDFNLIKSKNLPFNSLNQNSLFYNDLKSIYSQLRETFIDNKEADDHNNKPFLQIDLFFVLKSFCCSKYRSPKEENLQEMYDFAYKIFEEKLDVKNYLKILDQMKSYFSFNMNYFQRLSLEYLKKTNLCKQNEREELDKEYKMKSKSEYQEEELDSIMLLLLYYIDILENKETNQVEKYDKIIINSLDPFIKSLIQKFLVREKRKSMN